MTNNTSLAMIGYNAVDINNYNSLIAMFGSISRNKAMAYLGCDDMYFRKLKMLDKIYNDPSIDINTLDGKRIVLNTLYRNLDPTNGKIPGANLMNKLLVLSNSINSKGNNINITKKVPKKVFLLNLPQGLFYTYNSAGKGPKGMYDAVEVKKDYVIVKVLPAWPIKYDVQYKVEGIAELVRVCADKTILIKVFRHAADDIKKLYVIPCNCFVIFASVRMPQEYILMSRILCINGSSIYVYADTASSTRDISAKLQSRIAFDYGYLKSEIMARLVNIDSIIFKYFNAVDKEDTRGVIDYTLPDKSAIVEDEETAE